MQLPIKSIEIDHETNDYKVEFSDPITLTQLSRFCELLQFWAVQRSAQERQAFADYLKANDEK